MFISLIIPTKNRYDHFNLTLMHLLKCFFLPHEIIIVDQSSQANYQNFINTNYHKIEELKKKQVEVKYLYMPNIDSLLKAREFGFNSSKGDIIVFLDDDITIFPDFFYNIYNFFYLKNGWDAICAVDIQNSQKSLCGLIFKSLFMLGPFWDKKLFVNKFHNYLHKPIKTKKFSAGYMALKREVYSTIRFDLNLKGQVFVGDIDFSFRASKKYSLAIYPRLKVIHRGIDNPSYNIFDGEFKRIHSRIYFFKKNIDKNFINFLALIWLVFGSFLAATLRCFKFRSFVPIRGFIQGFWYVIRN